MRTRPDLREAAIVALLYVVATALFVRVHADLRVSHGVLVYILLIVAAAAVSGRVFAWLMVVASYVAVDWLFVPPIGSFGTPANLDGILLVGFVMVGFVMSEMVVRYRAARDAAVASAAEVAKLAARVAREESRREAEDVKNALLASIAHDLRSPLAAIRQMAEEHAEAARIGDETERIARYLDAVLAFVRSNAAAPHADRVHVADDLVGAAIRAAALTGREVRVSVPDGDDLVLGEFDFALALRALQNLLENAGRYSPSGTPIDVAVRTDGDRMTVTVRDRGPGLAPGEESRVFEPLSRGEAGRGTAGTGLGLAIARTFARSQGGDVRYAPADGGGAAFTLELRRTRL